MNWTETVSTTYSSHLRERMLPKTTLQSSAWDQYEAWFFQAARKHNWVWSMRQPGDCGYGSSDLVTSNMIWPRFEGGMRLPACLQSKLRLAANGRCKVELLVIAIPSCFVLAAQSLHPKLLRRNLYGYWAWKTPYKNLVSNMERSFLQRSQKIPRTRILDYEIIHHLCCQSST